MNNNVTFFIILCLFTMPYICLELPCKNARNSGLQIKLELL